MRHVSPGAHAASARVALSVVIAIFASYAALDIAANVSAANGWARRVWLAGGAGAMGFGG